MQIHEDLWLFLLASPGTVLKIQAFDFHVDPEKVMKTNIIRFGRWNDSMIVSRLIFQYLF